MPPRQRKFIPQRRGLSRRPPGTRKAEGEEPAVPAAGQEEPVQDAQPRARAPAQGRRARQPAPRAQRAAPGPAPDQEGESWEQVADWYDSLASDQGTEFHQHVIIPGVLRLLELKAGEEVLDLACGQGAVSRALHQAGAKVTGVDLSPRLIQLARRRSSPEVRYLVGDARRLDALAGGRFDAAACVLAAQNLDPLEPLLAEAARVLRPGGRLVLVLTHPAFRIPRQSGWRWDTGRKLMLRELARYLTPLKIPIDMRPFKGPGRQMTWTYHRPIQEYVNGLAAAGLWTNALEEWPSHKVSQPGPASRGENRARQEFPLFLTLRAVKVAPTPPARPGTPPGTLPAPPGGPGSRG